MNFRLLRISIGETLKKKKNAGFDPGKNTTWVSEAMTHALRGDYKRMVRRVV